MTTEEKMMMQPTQEYIRKLQRNVMRVLKTVCSLPSWQGR